MRDHQANGTPGKILVQTGETAGRLIDRLAYWLGWLMLAMMVITNLVVLLRYGFNQGSVMLQESVQYLHATALMLGFACTLRQDGHVRVDLFYAKFSARYKAVVNLLGHLLFLIPTALVIGLGSFDYVVAAWAIREASPEADGIPAIFLLKTLIPLSALLLLIQGVIGCGQAVATVRGHKADASS